MLKKQHMDNFQFGGEYNLNVRVFSNDKSVIFSEIWRKILVFCNSKCAQRSWTRYCETFWYPRNEFYVTFRKVTSKPKFELLIKKKNSKELSNIKVGLSITANSLLGSIKTRWSGQSIFSSAER